MSLITRSALVAAVVAGLMGMAASAQAAWPRVIVAYPPVVGPAPVTTYYAPIAPPAPVTAYYAPAAAPVTTYYAPAAPVAPVVAVPGTVLYRPNPILLPRRYVAAPVVRSYYVAPW